VPPSFSDSGLTANASNYLRHDVGTLTPASGQRLGEALDGLDTPGLAGLWASAPYLHDGSAATLLDVLTTRNTNDQHGTTSALTAEQRTDLVEYLLSLDGSPFDEMVDADGDGMTDEWERRHGLDPALATDADADTDGDGVTNLAEFRAGTNPTERNSLPFIRRIAFTAGEVRFSFPSVKGRIFTVQATPSLLSANWQALATFNGDGAEMTFLITNRNVGAQFYRVRADAE
jgi:hypothetical protein